MHGTELLPWINFVLTCHLTGGESRQFNVRDWYPMFVVLSLHLVLFQCTDDIFCDILVVPRELAPGLDTEYRLQEG